jgi:hypothetical protein
MSTPTSPVTVLEKLVVTTSTPAKQTISQQHSIPSKTGQRDELKALTATVGLAPALGLVPRGTNSTTHTAEQQGAILHHVESNDTLTTHNPGHYKKDNTEDDEKNTTLASGNNVDIYEDWNSEGEELDTRKAAAGNYSQYAQAVEAIESDLAADTSHQVDEHDDGIQNYNADTDEILDKELDPEGFVVDSGSIAHVLGAGGGGLGVNQSFQITSGNDEGDIIEDFNPDTDEVLDELDGTNPYEI